VESTCLAGRSILVVEDEPLIRFDLTMRLEAAGATVLAASHLTDAIDLADHSISPCSQSSFGHTIGKSCPEIAALVREHTPLKSQTLFTCQPNTIPESQLKVCAMTAPCHLPTRRITCGLY
jgi:CheY-like chemotaxis protein